MKLINTYWCLACVPLYCGSLCPAQEITVRVINASNGRPLQKLAVSVGFLYDKNYDKKIPAKYPRRLSLETDANGEAHFNFPEPPPTHFGAGVRMDESRWKCRCAILASTDDLFREGIVDTVAMTDLKKFKPVPGQILIVARPLSFFERLLYPLLKE